MTQNPGQSVESAEQHIVLPPLPAWPTSRPGPRVTEPPAGMKRLYTRSEQLVEADSDHDQVQGKAAAKNSQP